MTANTDGSCEPNPGPGSCAFILRDAEGRQVRADGFYLGPDCTNNTAEFEAVIRAAQIAIEHQASSLRILSDSRLAVMILTGRWKAKQPHLKELRQQALGVLDGIPQWTIEWVPRERNVAADTVSGNALKFRRNVRYDLPVLDPKESDDYEIETSRPGHKRRILAAISSTGDARTLAKHAPRRCRTSHSQGKVNADATR